MKKICVFIVAIIASIAIIAIFYFGIGGKFEQNLVQPEPVTEGRLVSKNSVEYAGWLKTSGSQLQNEKGEPMQLRGISSHGIAWFSDLITYENLENLKKEWNINVFRIAMYTDPSASGYISNPEVNKEIVNQIIEMAKDLDMYVIVDWHILNDNNPQIYETQAREFFNELSKEYADTPNVIYEICNEPNGENVKWNENVKPYAEDIVATIRANSPKSLIIVGTPDWCKDVDVAADNPLKFENIVYSCHFYAGSHGKLLQDNIEHCLQAGIPVFVSECGITDASGAGNIYDEDFKLWIDYLNEKNISWIYWSLSNKDESSSILTPQYYVVTNNTGTTNENIAENVNNNLSEQNESNVENNISTSEKLNNEVPVLYMDDYLTESGKILKDIFLSYGEDEKVVIK